MAESYFAKITPIAGPERPTDPDYGLPGPRPTPMPPIAIPPLPPGFVMPPIHLPPEIWPPQPPVYPIPPIFIPGGPDNTLPGTPGTPGTPDNSLPMPPATIWPPLPPGSGIAGKGLALIWLVGVGYRWLVVQGPDIWPPVAQPK